MQGLRGVKGPRFLREKTVFQTHQQTHSQLGGLTTTGRYTGSISSGALRAGWEIHTIAGTPAGYCLLYNIVRVQQKNCNKRITTGCGSLSILPIPGHAFICRCRYTDTHVMNVNLMRHSQGTHEAFSRHS